MKKLLTLAFTAAVIFTVWVSPVRAGPTPLPAWTMRVAHALIGTQAASSQDPGFHALTVDELAADVYNSAVSTRNYRGLGHRPVDPSTGAFLDAKGNTTSANATDGLSVSATPLTGCSGNNDQNATCHAYAPTARSAYIVGNTCYTNPTVADGCMGEPNNNAWDYYCGPGASRVVASNWYYPPIYQIGASPPNSSSKGYAWYENTSVTGGTLPSNIPTPTNNDVINHIGVNPGLINGGGSDSQNTFQSRVGYDVTANDALITGLMTRGSNPPLPEWSNWPNNVAHFVTIYSYDFSNYNGAINYFDSAAPDSGSSGPRRFGMYVYQFWNNVKGYNYQIYVP